VLQRHSASCKQKVPQHKQKILATTRANDVDLAKTMVTSAAFDVNEALNSGQTAVSPANSPEIITILTSIGKVDWNVPQHKQKILDIIADDDVDLASILVASAGFIVNEALNSDGETAVSAANSSKTMTMLISAGKVD